MSTRNWLHDHLHLHDRPLAGEPHPDRPFHWSLYGCEAVATALLMFLGCGAIVLLLAPGSPIAQILSPFPAFRIALCGLGFGLAATATAHTPFGKVSGAHLSPSVTLAFWRGGRIKTPDALGYMIAQCIGAAAGTAALGLPGLAYGPWRDWLASVNYGGTLPDAGVNVFWPLVTEIGVTALLIGLLYWLAAHPRWRWLAPWGTAIYFFLANPLTAWLSGNSTNLARSLGPALVSGQWSGFWIYILGPFVGALLMVTLIKTHIFGRLHLPEARLINFGHHGRVPPLSDLKATKASPSP